MPYTLYAAQYRLSSIIFDLLLASDKRLRIMAFSHVSITTHNDTRSCLVVRADRVWRHDPWQHRHERYLSTYGLHFPLATARIQISMGLFCALWNSPYRASSSAAVQWDRNSCAISKANSGIPHLIRAYATFYTLHFCIACGRSADRPIRRRPDHINSSVPVVQGNPIREMRPLVFDQFARLQALHDWLAPRSP